LALPLQKTLDRRRQYSAADLRFFPNEHHAMFHESPQFEVLKNGFAVIRAYSKLWIGVTVVVAGLATAYALVRPSTWEASQALMIRNEASGGQDTLGKFGQPEEMKSTQETLLELAKSQGVLSAALAHVGPAAGSTKADWPAAADVAALRDAVKITPPKGAEFGKTEVFYLKIRDRDPDRATALITAICDQVEASFQSVRNVRTASVVVELEKAVRLASDDLANSTARLSAIEKNVGADLAELRMLQETSSGESSLRRSMTDIRGELRQAESVRQSNRQLLGLLKSAQTEPNRLVATPNALLDSQPALRKLKDGLIDAQLNTAQLKGRMSDEHPLVLAAKASQDEIVNRLHDELANSLRGVEAELKLNDEKYDTLNKQLEAVADRLGKLAGLRAPYANQYAETKKCSEILDRAMQRLADARTSLASATASHWIARIDSPDIGEGPIGPGRGVMIAMGVVGGLFVGLGLVVLVAPVAGPLSRNVAAAAEKTTAANAESTVPPTASPISTSQSLAERTVVKPCAETRKSRTSQCRPVAEKSAGRPSLTTALRQLADRNG
jgi:uncharacterized protein involved in exopolysaccharide biosynthesis